MRMAGITSIVSLCWAGEIAPPKLKPHSRFVVFNPTIVAFPLLEIAKLSTQSYWATIVVSTDLDRWRNLFSFTSATMAPRKIIIDTDPVYCLLPLTNAVNRLTLLEGGRWHSGDTAGTLCIAREASSAAHFRDIRQHWSPKLPMQHYLTIPLCEQGDCVARKRWTEFGIWNSSKFEACSSCYRPWATARWECVDGWFLS